MSTLSDVATGLRHKIAWQAVQNFACWITSTTAGLYFWMNGWWPLTVVCWAITAWFGHAVLLAFHEASHGHLHRIHRANELAGNMIGLIILVPMSAYRVVHGAHHVHLGTERDLELWPYVEPPTPRWFRVLSLVLELTIGFFYTPFLFLRGVVVSDISPAHKRRVWRAYLVSALAWGAILSLVAWFHAWEAFFVVYLAPAILGGNVQSLRKLTEHLGLLGNTPETAARTIVPDTVVGRWMTRTMLNVTHHAAHHRSAATRFDELPAETVRAVDDANLYVFRSYPEAFFDMLPSLADPKIGGQWLRAENRSRSSAGDFLPEGRIAASPHS